MLYNVPFLSFLFLNCKKKKNTTKEKEKQKEINKWHDCSEYTFFDKIKSHCKEQPLVPIGTLLTTGAVILAAQSLRTGQRHKAQVWFRWRVAFQGATIAALVVGGLLYGKKGIEKAETDAEIIEAKAKKLEEKAKLRERLWIEELERRDIEAKLRKERAENARLAFEKMKEEGQITSSSTENSTEKK